MKKIYAREKSHNSSFLFLWGSLRDSFVLLLEDWKLLMVRIRNKDKRIERLQVQLRKCPELLTWPRSGDLKVRTAKNEGWWRTKNSLQKSLKFFSSIFNKFRRKTIWCQCRVANKTGTYPWQFFREGEARAPQEIRDEVAYAANQMLNTYEQKVDRCHRVSKVRRSKEIGCEPSYEQNKSRTLEYCRPQLVGPWRRQTSPQKAEFERRREEM